MVASDYLNSYRPTLGWRLRGADRARARSDSYPELCSPAFQRELEIDPNNVLARYKLGEIAVEKGDGAKAKELMEAAQREKPGLVHMDYNLGRAEASLHMRQRDVRDGLVEHRHHGGHHHGRRDGDPIGDVRAVTHSDFPVPSLL